ncbi:hypothetical protein AVDCRST_MAG92-5618, partial [uncultured Coleofasciculus sp.]
FFAHLFSKPYITSNEVSQDKDLKFIAKTLKFF